MLQTYETIQKTKLERMNIDCEFYFGYTHKSMGKLSKAIVHQINHEKVGYGQHSFPQSFQTCFK